MKCADHRDHELAYLEKYAQLAHEQELRNAVCLTADMKKRWQLKEVAAFDFVEEIATDPYYPNVFASISEEDRVAYVTDWSAFTTKTADDEGKASHVWVQTFNVPRAKERMVREHVAACRQSLADVALWGFRACQSVPDFHTQNDAPAAKVWRAAKAAISEASMYYA